MEELITKITKEQLKMGLDLVRTCATCPNSIHCLWGNSEDIPEEDIPEEEDCLVLEFREILETDSPHFYEKLLELSEYSRRVHNLYGLRDEGGSAMQMREATIEFHDLRVFTQLICLALYPLILANKEEVPFLALKDIEEISVSEEDPRIVGEKMSKLNPDWLDWVRVSMLGNLTRPEKYTEASILAIKLFFLGLQNAGLPRSEMSEEEKESLFKNIEDYLKGDSS